VFIIEGQSPAEQKQVRAFLEEFLTEYAVRRVLFKLHLFIQRNRRHFRQESNHMIVIGNFNQCSSRDIFRALELMGLRSNTAGGFTVPDDKSVWCVFTKALNERAWHVMNI